MRNLNHLLNRTRWHFALGAYLFPWCLLVLLVCINWHYRSLTAFEISLTLVIIAILTLLYFVTPSSKPWGKGFIRLLGIIVFLWGGALVLVHSINLLVVQPTVVEIASRITLINHKKSNDFGICMESPKVIRYKEHSLSYSPDVHFSFSEYSKGISFFEVRESYLRLKKSAFQSKGLIPWHALSSITYDIDFIHSLSVPEECELRIVVDSISIIQETACAVKSGHRSSLIRQTPEFIDIFFIDGMNNFQNTFELLDNLAEITQPGKGIKVQIPLCIPQTTTSLNNL